MGITQCFTKEHFLIYFFVFTAYFVVVFIAPDKLQKQIILLIPKRLVQPCS